MDPLLNDVEVRVLGALIEKQIATPDYYPLTLNSLLAACNQRSNREPVVNYTDQTVLNAIETLRPKHLVYIYYASESRVPKYKHRMGDHFGLDARESAIMCVLMLRGPQTIGEIRTRTTRLHNFADLNEVKEVLDKLISREDEPLVAVLASQPGQKEVRYAHLLEGKPVIPESRSTGHGTSGSSLGERVAELETIVTELREQVNEIQSSLDTFRKEFE
ncbi:MAG: uncharacterized protein QOJ64_2478 [Acidobacteriota bacterium]|jgi:uncharacterized protein YceH (UPF0502 family)|nr:uncharacterized protein [Acidobacteriota bacterium]